MNDVKILYLSPFTPLTDEDADDRLAKQKLTGMIVPNLQTQKGNIIVNY